MTNQSNWYSEYKKAAKGLKTIKSGFDVKKNYSSFWMDDRNDYYANKDSRFTGLNPDSKVAATSDIVRVIKLASYQRAIANFVKILTKKDIPVIFKGDTSYTDFNHITLSTDIKDNNFDVSVGLALHEASHILLTDPTYLTVVFNDDQFRHQDQIATWKSLLNWIEDRRIDNFIFTTSPGYKAYYHKMYDFYWNDKKITKGLLSSSFRDSSDIDAWMFRIINSLNPASNPTAMPGLKDVLSIIDVKTIGRLKSVQESGELATMVLDIIKRYLNAAPTSKPKEEEVDEQVETNPGESGEGQGEGNSDNDSNDTDSGKNDSDENGEPLSVSDELAIKSIVQAQRKFLNNDVNKKVGTKQLTNKLRDISKSNVEVIMVGEGQFEMNSLLYDFSGDSKIMQAADVSSKWSSLVITPDGRNRRYSNRDEESMTREEEVLANNYKHEWETITNSLPDGYNNSISDSYAESITKGLEMGALLGKKLQVRNESRELVFNRMHSGHIDNRRLAQAGFGIETVFKQIHTDQYRKANLHISLDGSGSMGGTKWENTVRMCLAIAKAATYIQNLDIQVSIRTTQQSGRVCLPVTTYVYDSRKNPLKQLISIMRVFHPTNYTPEGLCFETMIRKDLIVAGGKELDSYFLNISDGEPGGITGYSGSTAIRHTAKQITKLKNLYNVNVLAFFMHDHGKNYQSNDRGSFGNFQSMYGKKDSKLVDASDAAGIAKALNDKFLSADSMMQ